MNARKPSPTSKRSTPADAKGASTKSSTGRPRPAAKPKAATTRKAAPAKAKAAPAKAKAAPAKAKAKAAPAKAKAKAPPRKPAARADLGAPIAGFFRKQPPLLRAILDQLHALIEAAAPDASSSIKWGMPFYMIGDEMMCALGGHKSHVNLILSGPPGTFADPGSLLAGDGKTGRHLKLIAGDKVPHDAVRGWLRTAVERARAAATTIARR